MQTIKVDRDGDRRVRAQLKWLHHFSCIAPNFFAMPNTLFCHSHFWQKWVFRANFGIADAAKRSLSSDMPSSAGAEPDRYVLPRPCNVMIGSDDGAGLAYQLCGFNATRWVMRHLLGAFAIDDAFEAAEPLAITTEWF